MSGSVSESESVSVNVSMYVCTLHDVWICTVEAQDRILCQTTKQSTTVSRIDLDEPLHSADDASFFRA